MTEKLGIGYVGIKGMRYGAVPPIPPAPGMIPEKLVIARWQRDACSELFGRKAKTYEEWLDIERFIDAHFEVESLEQKGGDEIKNVYVFFGYKQDATKYRLEHDIDPRDMVVVSSTHMLVNRRARPIRVGLDSKWYWLNFNHRNSIDARYYMSVMEAYYGSAK